MKKVCLVSDTVYDLNGVSRFIQDFAQEAQLQNKEFYVFTSTLKEGLIKLSNIENTKPLVSIKMPFYKSLSLVLPNYKTMKHKIQEFNPDIIHISTPGPVGLCALVIAKKLNIPTVGIYHTDFPAYLYKNTNSKFLEKITGLYLKYFYKSFKALFCRTCVYKEIIVNDLAFDVKNIYTLKAGINTKRFSPIFNNRLIWEKYNINKNAFKALYVGRISVEKNINQLLSIWSKVNNENKVLILVGDSEINLNEYYCKKYNIIHLGRRQGETLSTLYASSDCFLFPSTTDTLGQVVLEALCSGLPVCVTNKGGPKTFANSKVGTVMDIDDEKAWADTITQWSKKGFDYQQMVSNTQTYAKDYSISESFEHFWEQNKIIYSTL